MSNANDDGFSRADQSLGGNWESLNLTADDELLCIAMANAFYGRERMDELGYAAELEAARMGQVLELLRSKPIDMLLYCPVCGLQHIDAPTEEWKNPPHKSHLCHGCKTIWRQADHATNGVKTLATGKDYVEPQWLRVRTVVLKSYREAVKSALNWLGKGEPCVPCAKKGLERAQQVDAAYVKEVT